MVFLKSDRMGSARLRESLSWWSLGWRGVTRTHHLCCHSKHPFTIAWLSCNFFFWAFSCLHPASWGLGPAPLPLPHTSAWDPCCPLPWGVGGGGPCSISAAISYSWRGLFVGAAGSESSAGPVASGTGQGSGLSPTPGSGTQHVPHRGCNPLGVSHFLCVGEMGPREGEVHFPTPLGCAFSFCIGFCTLCSWPRVPGPGAAAKQQRRGGMDTFSLLIPSLVGSGIRLQNFPLRNFINAAQTSCLYSHNFSVLECLLLASLIFQLLLIFKGPNQYSSLSQDFRPTPGIIADSLHWNQAVS